jgi:hypothetical protein
MKAIAKMNTFGKKEGGGGGLSASAVKQMMQRKIVGI